jgi:hypothetical protein
MLTPLAPVDVRQLPRRAPLCPSGRLHGDGASCPGGPDSLRRGLRGRARRVGARMSAHVPMQLCHGGRAGRTNRNKEESEAEGTAPLLFAGEWEEQYKPATRSHAKRLRQPCQPDPSWPPVDSSGICRRAARLCVTLEYMWKGGSRILSNLPQQKAQVFKARRRYRGEQEERYNGKDVAWEIVTQRGGASV